MIELDTICGSHINDVILTAVRKANATGECVRFEFNGIAVTLDNQSNPDLVYRDWQRAMGGCIGKAIGPAFPEHLTPDEILADAKVRAESERLRLARQAKADQEAAAKAARVERILAECPPLDVADHEKWATCQADNQDPYGQGVLRYAERWARMMQREIAAGKTVGDAAKATQFEADIEGITGYMHGCAVSILVAVWRHGDALKFWKLTTSGI